MTDLMALIQYRLMEEAEVTKEDVNEMLPKVADFVSQVKDHLLGSH